MAQHLSL